MSHSMLKFPAIAACAAPGMFSMMPRARSGSPRWATGRAVNQSGARIRTARLRDFEQSLDLDRCVRGKRGDADRGAGMAALVAERGPHQVGSPVQNLRPVEKIGREIDKAAEPHNADPLVEVAERGLDLREQIDGTAAGGRVALLAGH